MKKIALLLCLAILFSSCVFFASCNQPSSTARPRPDTAQREDENPSPEPTVPTATIHLNGYHFVYGDDITDNGIAQINDVAEKIKTLSGVDLEVQDEETATGSLEILVGNTDRAQTQAALALLSEEGWTVSVMNGRIVIVGTTPFLTRVALTHFATNCILPSAFENGALKLAESTVEKTGAAALFAGDYSIIYHDSVDDLIGVDTEWLVNEWARSPETVGGTYVDYAFEIAYDMQKQLGLVTDAASSAFPLRKAYQVQEGSGQILVGAVNRSDCLALMNTLAANEYGISIKDGKIMLLAWNDVTLNDAYHEFKEMLTASTRGGICILPKEAFLVMKKGDALWPTDFPKPEGENVQLTATADIGGWQGDYLQYRGIRENVFGVRTGHGAYSSDTLLQYVYTGEGITRAFFTDYIERLTAAGYVKMGAENYNSVAGFSAQTLYHAQTGIYLHVYHTPYQFSHTITEDDAVNSLHITAAYSDGTELNGNLISGITLPGNEILAPQSFSNIAVSKMVAVGMKNEGMSYVLALADGSFVIFDGGLAANTDTLWNLLCTLHEQAHGSAPSANNPIRVRLWILTHEHGDHYTVFTETMEDLRTDADKKAKFRLDYVFYNDLSESEAYSSNNSTMSVLTCAKFKEWQGCVEGGFKHVSPQTGQVFYFANLKLEVLYTFADTYPQKLAWGNNASTIYRTTMTVTDANGTDETTCVWLGDAEVLPGHRIQALWGTALRSDMVQLAHHGSLAVEQSLYNLIAPTIVLFPAMMTRYTQSMKPNQSGTLKYSSNGIIGQGAVIGTKDTTKTMPYNWYTFWNYTVNRYVLTELSSVQLVIFSGDATSGGSSTAGQNVALLLYGDGVDSTPIVVETGEAASQKEIPPAWASNTFDQVMTRGTLDSALFR